VIAQEEKTVLANTAKGGGVGKYMTAQPKPQKRPNGGGGGGGGGSAGGAGGSGASGGGGAVYKKPKTGGGFGNFSSW